MSIKRGEITTKIIKNGLVFNMDAANRASYPKTGTITTDTVGNITGSFEANPIFVDIPTSASCWEFDGVDDRIIWGTYTSTVGELENLGDTNTWSIWLQIRNNGNFMSGASANQSRVSYNTGNNFIYVYFTPNTGNYLIISNDVGTLENDNQFHNIVITQNKTIVNVYVDGVDYGLNASYNTLDSGKTIKPNSIGAAWNASFDFQGEIANTQVYNRALSAEEVLYNYNGLKSRFGL